MRRAQRLAPHDEAVLHRARLAALVLAGQRDEGIPLLEQVVAKEPDRYDAQLLLGHYWHDDRQVARLDRRVRGVLREAAGRARAGGRPPRIELADSYLRYRQPKKALALFERAATAAQARSARAHRRGVGDRRVDCKKARGLLHDLEPSPSSIPRSGSSTASARSRSATPVPRSSLGRRYLEREAKGSAAGHALVGEAQAARGNLGEARKELETARDARAGAPALDGAARVRAAARGQAQADAVAALDKLGPPAAPGIDPDWWLELGESLLAQGDARGRRHIASRRSSPELAERRRDPHRARRGAARSRPAPRPRSRRSTRPRRLRARRAAQAAGRRADHGRGRKLRRTTPRAPSRCSRARTRSMVTPLVWRDLGIARLALNKPADAVTVLDSAAKADAAPARVDARRPRARAGRRCRRRAPLYEKRRSDRRRRTARSRSRSTGRPPSSAGRAIRRVAVARSSGPRPPRRPAARAPHKAALATRATPPASRRSSAGNGTKAVELLRASAAARHALDEVRSRARGGRRRRADRRARRAQGDHRPVLPVPPARRHPGRADPDRVHRRPQSAKRAGKALDRLTSLDGKSSGPAAVLLGTAIRSSRSRRRRTPIATGKIAQARKYRIAAQCREFAGRRRRGRAQPRGHRSRRRQVDARSRSSSGCPAKVPEALDQPRHRVRAQGRPGRRRSMRGGARARPACGSRQLTDWIEAKERIYGGRALPAPSVAILLRSGVWLLASRPARRRHRASGCSRRAPFPSTGGARRARQQARDASARRSVAPARQGLRACGDFARAVKKGDVRSRSSMRRTSRAPAVATPCLPRRCAAAIRARLAARRARRGARWASSGQAVLVPASAGARPTSCSTCCSRASPTRLLRQDRSIAPDTASALAALGLGKADAAVSGGGRAAGGRDLVLALPPYRARARRVRPVGGAAPADRARSGASPEMRRSGVQGGEADAVRRSHGGSACPSSGVRTPCRRCVARRRSRRGRTFRSSARRSRRSRSRPRRPRADRVDCARELRDDLSGSRARTSRRRPRRRWPPRSPSGGTRHNAVGRLEAHVRNLLDRAVGAGATANVRDRRLRCDERPPGLVTGIARTPAGPA